MKKIALAMMMFAGVLTSCSTDDLTFANEDVNNANPTIVPFSDPNGASCVEVAALGGTATLSDPTSQQVTFEWNNEVEYDADKTYVSYIELAEDTDCPNPVWASAPVASTHDIDVFNTTSLVIPGVSAKCFQWRIVINGYEGSVLSCSTVSEWKSVSYVQ